MTPWTYVEEESPNCDTIQDANGSTVILLAGLGSKQKEAGKLVIRAVNTYDERDALLREAEQELRMARPTHYLLARIRKALGETGCKRCGATPIREVLDGEPLCQACCNAWVRAEGQALKEMEE